MSEDFTTGSDEWEVVQGKNKKNLQQQKDHKSNLTKLKEAQKNIKSDRNGRKFDVHKKSKLQDTVSLKKVSKDLEQLSVVEPSSKANSPVKRIVPIVRAPPVLLETRNISNVEFCQFCQLNAYHQQLNEVPLSSSAYHSFSLINTRNECYRNCILLSLFAIPSFYKTIDYLLAQCRCIPNTSYQLLPSLGSWRQFLAFAEQVIPASSLNNDVLNNGNNLNPSLYSSAFLILVTDYMIDLCQEFDRRNAHNSSSTSSTIVPSTNMISSSSVEQANGESSNHSKAPLMSPPMNESSSFAQSMPQQAQQQQQQQDAMEFFTYLLDILHEELVKVHEHLNIVEKQLLLSSSSLSTNSVNNHQSTATTTATTATKSTTAGDDWNTVVSSKHKSKVKVDDKLRLSLHQQISFTPISRLFHGILRSEVYPKSKKTISVTFQRFHCLTLNIRQVVEEVTTAASSLQSVITIQQALARFFGEESLEDEKYRKIVRLEAVPSVLVLQLARFAYDHRKQMTVKVNTHVDYPLVLSLHPTWLAQDSQEGRVDDEPVTFHLSAIVLHHGKRTTGGHYTAITKEKTKQDGTIVWKHADDEKLVELTEEEALAATDKVYLLFYSRDET